MGDKLKPCPFCGGEGVIDTHSFFSDKTKDFTDKTYGVVCVECGSRSNQFYPTKKEARQMWNRRADNDR